MAVVNIVKTSDGFSVKFPFELKDAFKEAFKTAKWDQDQRVWKVGPRSEARLKQFAEECESLATTISEKEETEMSASELEKLCKNISEIKHLITVEKNKVAALDEIRGEIEQCKQVLSAVKGQLDAANATHDAKKRAVDDEKKRIDAELSKLIDIDQLKGVVLATFAKYHGSVGGTARGMFNQAQNQFGDARDTLADAGLSLEALDYLCSANFNRPDRDGVKFMPRNAWYNLEQL